jgi:thiol-disulfide isomerase/thioredoxin
MWLNKLNYGTFTGIQPVSVAIPEFQFTDKDGNTVTNLDFSEKYTILDFWNTGCGFCFQKFPEFEEQYVKYRSNSKVSLYAVNVKLPRDREGISFDIISEKGYSFPTLQFGQIEDAKNIFGVIGYPTVVVLNPAGVMVFRGDMEKAVSFVESELKK